MIRPQRRKSSLGISGGQDVFLPPEFFQIKTDYTAEELMTLGNKIISQFPEEELEHGLGMDWEEIREHLILSPLKKAHPCLLWIAFYSLHRKKKIILDKFFYLGLEDNEFRLRATEQNISLILKEFRINLFAVMFCLQEDIIEQSREKRDSSLTGWPVRLLDEIGIEHCSQDSWDTAFATLCSRWRRILRMRFAKKLSIGRIAEDELDKPSSIRAILRKSVNRLLINLS